jgi:NAD+ diphosphatase
VWHAPLPSHYPRLSPELIVLVRDGSRMVLARSPGFPAGMYSLLPDFVEPGESIEEAVKRELTQLDAPPAGPTPP